MRAYYQDARVAIYCGDSLEILPQLPSCEVLNGNRIERVTCDLIVTDPPYGVQWKSCAAQLELKSIAGDTQDGASHALSALAVAVAGMRRKRHVYAFGRWDFSLIGLDGTCELIWDKNTPGRPLNSQWMSQHDYITFGVKIGSKASVEARGEGNSPARLRRGTVLRCDRLNSASILRHPTEKPVQLLRELIESSSTFGEAVLDPFMGSGSTLVAAKLEGRRGIGIDIEERYCEMAAARFSADIKFPEEIERAEKAIAQTQEGK